MKDKYLIDLFCGAGGVSEGAIQAGFIPIFSSDISSDVQKTYMNRHTQLGLIQDENAYFLREDIRNLSGEIIFNKLNNLPAYNKTFKSGDIDLVFGGPSCFTADTLILTKNGYKPIIEIQIGDEVLAHDKKYHKVTDILKQGKKNIYKMSGFIDLSVNTTLNHKFYVRKRTFKYDKNSNSYIIYLHNPEWLSLEELINNDNYKNYLIGTTFDKTIKISKNLNNKNLWYLIGNFIRTGEYTKKSIILEFDEQCKIIESLKYNFSRSIVNDKYYYVFNDKNLLNILSEFQNKIPYYVYNLPKHLLKSFFEGFCSNKTKPISNENKIIITYIYMKLCNKESKQINKYNGVTVYEVINDLPINIDNDIYKKNFYDDNYFWYSISNIENLMKEEEVYDITVEDAHSFIANNIIAHNCQGFSMLGKRDKNDPRNMLFKEYVRILSEIRPKYAAMENVVGFNSFSFCGFEGLDGEIYPDGSTAPYILKKELNKIGYEILEPKVLCASDYGVPQNRKRAIFIAYRKDQKKPSYPEPIGNRLNVIDGIGDLNLGGITHNYQYDSIVGRTKSFITNKPIARQKILNNETPLHSSVVRERFSLYKEGESTNNLRKRIKEEGIDISNKSSLIALFKEDMVDKFKKGQVTDDDINILLTKKNIRTRLSKNKPSNTIITIPDDYISPFKDRTFTVRELARLQSFDDSFEFLGKKSTGGNLRKTDVPQCSQVGNAVPPLMAKAICLEIMKCLKD